MICSIRALFGPHAPNGTNTSNTLKQGKLDLQMAFGFESRLFQMPNPGNGRHEKVMFFGITGIQKNSYEGKQVEQFCK